MASTAPSAVYGTVSSVLGSCLRHALNKLPSRLIGVSSTMRQGVRAKFHALLHRGRQRKSLQVVALGQRLRRFAGGIATAVGEEHGARDRHGSRTRKRAGMRSRRVAVCRR